jgi:REP element-mobilizing transposase RayT
LIESVAEAELRKMRYEAGASHSRFAEKQHASLALSHLRNRVSLLPDFDDCRVAAGIHSLRSRDIILDSWRYLQKNDGLQLFAYVILENHIHWIAKSPDLANVVKRFKSYTVRQIVDFLERRVAKTLLIQLELLKPYYKTESDHQVWQEGNHPQQIASDEMMLQKLEYIHNNPLERGYVDDPVHWKYSSARNYARLQGLIEVITQWS